MTSEIYSRWLKGWDSQLRDQKRKILLLHDNCPAHNIMEELVTLTNIELTFPPPNTTAILQPCDQGIIALTKRAYRKMMCRAVLDKMETFIDANQDAKSGNIAKKISLLQAMQFWRDAWDSISKEAIQNCWKKANLEEYHGLTSEFVDEESEITFNLPFARDVIERWMTVDSELETSPPATEDEIIREVSEKFHKDDQSDEDEDENDSFTVAPAPVTCDEAKAAFDILNRFILETDTNDKESSLHFQYKRLIQTKTSQKLRQVTLERFFK